MIESVSSEIFLNLKDYVIGQQALITIETVIKAFSIVKNMEDYYSKKK
ncbi:hypothetical protein [Clostridium beijerinckii]|nr:hypothetical protein [Clostridium beijerinckii]